MIRPAARGPSRAAVRTGARILLGLAVPSLLYYALRALGSTIYVALVASTIVSALPALYSLVRHRRVDGLSTYFSAMMLGGLVVALGPGAPASCSPGRRS